MDCPPRAVAVSFATFQKPSFSIIGQMTIRINHLSLINAIFFFIIKVELEYNHVHNTWKIKNIFSDFSSTINLAISLSGPVGMAAAAAVATGKKRKRPHIFESNPSIRKRQQTRLLRYEAQLFFFSLHTETQQ